MNRITLYLSTIAFLILSNGFSYKKIKKEYKASDIELFQMTKVSDVAQAVKDEDTKQIKKFFAKRKDLINTQEPKFGFTLLMWSAYNHKFESAKTLLKLGANPNITSYKGVSPLIRVSEFSSFEFVKLLVENGADPNYVMDSLPPGTALIASISSNPSKEDLKKVKYFIDLGVNLDTTNFRSNTALNTAVIFKSFEIAELLIKKGANMDIPVFKFENGKRELATKNWTKS